MENASKALLIAGGVLLMILVLSVANYIFREISANASDIYSDLEESEITEFNQKFLNYEGRTDLNIQDVVTIINIAKDNDVTGKIPTSVIVKVDNAEWQTKTTKELNELLKNDIDSKYTCSAVNYNSNSKIVSTVIITTNP
jgi:hypothetical protein